MHAVQCHPQATAIQNPVSGTRTSISSDPRKSGGEVFIVNVRVRYVTAIIAWVSLVTNVCK